GQLVPILEDALPFCPFGTFPHTVGNHPAELSQLDRSSPTAEKPFRVFMDLLFFFRCLHCISTFQLF
ncbi:MAG: hypothetical protein MR484_00225, partial [Ruminococcus sp.]|nr:hypothetical protein [Ruminococcus sp.]